MFRDFHAFIFSACNNLEAEKISYHYTALSLSLYISLYHITVVISKIFSFTSALNTLHDKMQIHFTKHRLKITTVRLTRAVRPLWRIRWLPDTILICTVVVFIWSFWKAVALCTAQGAINAFFIWCACKISICGLKRNFTGRTYEQ